MHDGTWYSLTNSRDWRKFLKKIWFPFCFQIFFFHLSLYFGGIYFVILMSFKLGCGVLTFWLKFFRSTEVLEVDPWKLKLIRAILFSFQGAIKSHYGLLHSLLKNDPESQPANYTSSLLKLIVKPYCWLLLYAAALASTKGGYISNVLSSREGEQQINY